MKHRSFLMLFLCALCAVSCAVSGFAHAAPPGAQALAIPASQRPLLLRTGQGCGWDYPCPPRPDIRRRYFREPGQVYIHNNYGPVNVYPGGSRGAERADYWRRGECGAGACGERRDCGGYPCDEKCGPFCWMRRINRGYCGHGCWAYREQARIEAEQKEEWEELRLKWRERNEEERREDEAEREERV